MSTKSLEQLIGEKAYEIYQKRERDGRPGSSEGDWHQAVKEVMAEVNKKDKSAAKPVEKAAAKVAAVAPKPVFAPAPAPAPKPEIKKAAPAPAPVARPVAAAAKPAAAPVKKAAAKKK